MYRHVRSFVRCILVAVKLFAAALKWAPSPFSNRNLATEAQTRFDLKLGVLADNMEI